MIKPIRIFDTQLTGQPEFYASRNYREVGDSIQLNGEKTDVTQDILRLVVKYKLSWETMIRTTSAGAGERG